MKFMGLWKTPTQGHKMINFPNRHSFKKLYMISGILEINLFFRINLTHFSPVSHFYTP